MNLRECPPLGQSEGLELLSSIHRPHRPHKPYKHKKGCMEVEPKPKILWKSMHVLAQISKITNCMFFRHILQVLVLNLDEFIQRPTTIKGCLPFEVVFYLKSYSIESCLLAFIQNVFCSRSSFIQSCHLFK